MNIIGLIPSRLNSSRLPQKPLLEIEGIPLVIHTYRRAKLSKKLDDLKAETKSEPKSRIMMVSSCIRI